VQQTPPPGARRTVSPRTDTETRGEPASAATTTPGPSAPAEAPRVELKPVPSPAEPAIDTASVQVVIDKVQGLLKAVDPSKYNTGRYKDARRYAQQASDKLKERNLGSAAEAANKALKLATDLVGR